MYDIYRLFEGAAALIEEERVAHIRLYNRLFEIASELGGETVDEFIDGDLRIVVENKLADIIDEYPIPSYHEGILFNVIECHLEETQRVLEALRNLAGEAAYDNYILIRNEALVNDIVGYFPDHKTAYNVNYDSRGKVDDPIRDLLVVPLLEKDRKELEALHRKLHGVFKDMYEDGPEQLFEPSYYEKLRRTLRLMVTRMPEGDVYNMFDFIDESLTRLRRDFNENINGNSKTDALSRERLMECRLRDRVHEIATAIYPPLGGEKSVPLARKFNP